MANPTMEEMLKSANNIDDNLHTKKVERALAAAEFKVKQLTTTKKKAKAKA